ncbi:MAG: hypothetical protein U9R53_04795 [Chloroflexota bacterium]|nr:hypothetical protein [Chloroflexota bacterium]
MSKQFYTERDIEDLATRGQYSLDVGEDVVLTELAFEKAARLGVKLVQPHQLPPVAPIRPYLAEEIKSPTEKQSVANPVVSEDSDLRQRIRAAVKVKLGDQIDDNLLETIITRVLNNIGVS